MIWTLGVLIGNTKRCQLSYKALGKPIFPSSTFCSNLVITWKGLHCKMFSYSTRAECTLVLIHLSRPRYSTMLTIALWLVILVTLSPCTKPSRISIGKGWKSSSRCISRNVRSINVKNWNFSPWWTKSKHKF